MIARTSNYDVQTLHKTFDEISNKCDEVHYNISYNIEKCKKKKEKINTYSKHKINIYLQMIKRERQLTLYANNLISKQKLINSKKKQFLNRKDTEIQTLDEEIEKANIQLQAIYKEKRKLVKKKDDLQIKNNILSATIQKTTSILEQIGLREIEKESYYNNNRNLALIEDDVNKLTKKIEKRQLKIEKISDSFNSLNKSIIQLKIAIQNVQINKNSMKAKIFSSEARLKKVQNEINEFRNEIQSKQKNILDKTTSLKEEETNLLNLKNTAQVHCESIRQEINANKISMNEVKKLINDKTVDISLKNDQVNEIKVTIINLKEEKESALDTSIIKTEELKKSTDKIIDLNSNISSVTQQKEETESLLKKENSELQEIKNVVENSLPLVEDCIQLYNKIDDCLTVEESLNQLIKETENKKKQGLTNLENDQEIKTKKIQVQKIIKLLKNEIKIENANQNQIIQNIQAQQNQNLKYQQNLIEIENKIKEAKMINDPILLSIKSEPTFENVSHLIEALKFKREKRISIKKRDNEILQRRLNELAKSINIRKRKMKRQIESITKEKDEFDILPDEDKIVLKSIGSLNELVSQDILLWNKSDEVDSLLHSWENQMENLYNKLDEFILRK